jgi:hypothetical protein
LAECADEALLELETVDLADFAEAFVAGACACVGAGAGEALDWEAKAKLGTAMVAASVTARRIELIMIEIPPVGRGARLIGRHAEEPDCTTYAHDVGSSIGPNTAIARGNAREMGSE